jgi:uncharacterized damage-inducible protein DinB
MFGHRARMLAMIVLVGLGTAQIAAAQCGYSDALRVHWKRTRGMVTDIVAAMPEDKWDFRPVKEVRSFREMVKHMIQDSYSHVGYVMGMSREQSEKVAAKFDKLNGRDELLKALDESFDYGDKLLSQVTDKNAMDMVSGMRAEKMTRVEAALVLFEDQMDHYGNMVVYLRINGVVPPDTAKADAQRKANMEKNKGQAMPEEHMH